LQYNVLIVGAGAKGALCDAPNTENSHKYISYAHAVKDHPGFNLAGFYDNDISKAEIATQIWGGNVHDQIQNDYDVIIIATPDATHYNVLKLLCERYFEYPRLVICEKPICTDLRQAYEIINLYEKKGIPILCDYTRRFIPEYRQMKAEIDFGKAGKFLKGYCCFNRGVYHTASHFIDLALWFNGNMDNIIIQEVPTEYRWVFQWGMFYENEFYSEHAVNFVKNPRVDTVYDRHLYFVMENAWNYLEGKEPLICTGMDAVKALEVCDRFTGERMECE